MCSLGSVIQGPLLSMLQNFRPSKAKPVLGANHPASTNVLIQTRVSLGMVGSFHKDPVSLTYSQQPALQVEVLRMAELGRGANAFLHSHCIGPQPRHL